MTIGQAGPADLARAIAGAATTAGATSTAVRGADWRLGVVTAVGAGTVDVGQIRARRLDSYTLPAVGDQIVITQNSAGNWLAIGRTAANDSGVWTTLSLASGFVNPGHGYTAAWMREGKRIWLRGRIGRTSGTIANGATICTLPASIRPSGSALVGWAAPRNANVSPAVVRVEILDTGVLRTYESSNPPEWISLDGVTYTTD